MRGMPLSNDQLGAIPQALRDRRQWVLWKYTVRSRGEKPTKTPHLPDGSMANHADASTWSSFEDALQGFRRGGFDGIGFVFTEHDDFVGIDLDNCFTPDGTLKAWAVDIVMQAQAAECYIEKTPSGVGLHIIGTGKLPGRGRKITSLGEDRKGAIEVYDRLRYFTVTGDQTDIGDVSGDVSTLLQWVWSQYRLTEDAETHVEPGAGIPDSEADQIARVILERASADFRSLWVDLYDVNRHGSDRSGVRMSFLNKLAMKLKGDGHQLTVALVRGVALRAPFIRSEMSAGRGKKWPRLANEECTKAIQWANDSMAQVSEPAESLLLTYDELKKQAGGLSWVVKHILPASSVGVMFGASGTFKSFIALDGSMHVAHGLRWLNQRTGHAPVVYLAAEGGVGALRRVEAWHKARGMDPLKGQFLFCIRPLALLTQAVLLRREIERLQVQPALIVIDTMSQTFTGEENSSSEVAEFLRAVRTELAHPFGACVLIVHHSGHAATERPRGSSAIRANTDFLIGVHRDEKEMLATAEVVHQKDGELPDPITFGLNVVHLGKDQDGDAVTSLTATHLDSVTEVLESARRSRGGQLDRILAAVDTGRPEKEVRLAFYSSLEDSNPEARKKAFQRARVAALAAGIIKIEGDWWSVAVQQKEPTA